MASPADEAGSDREEEEDKGDVGVHDDYLSSRSERVYSVVSRIRMVKRMVNSK